MAQTTAMKQQKTIHVEASYTINARPETLYAIIADYQVAHQAILPMPPFTSVIVEKGGQGAGTVVLTHMKVFGKVYTFHQIVTEPEPGHILVETDMETGQFTQFIFDPLANGVQTRVTITSEFPRKPGFGGFIESISQPSFVRGIYMKELRILAKYVGKSDPVLTAG